MRFLIVVTGFNCAQYVMECYRSLQMQQLSKDSEWSALFIDDGSTDDTRTKINLIQDPRVTKLIYSTNEGAAKRRFDAINKYGRPDDIVVLVGMDDAFRTYNGLLRIQKEYDKGKWMSYGNYKTSQGFIYPKKQLHFDNDTHTNRSYRQVKYRSTAVNTFKKFLFDRLTEDDFKVNGEWIKATTESPVMFACLEMCGKEKIGVIEDPIYYYNIRKDNARKRLGDNYQDTIYKQVISRNPFPLWIETVEPAA